MSQMSSLPDCPSNGQNLPQYNQNAKSTQSAQSHKIMSPHHSDQMPQWPQVSRIILCMAKVKVSEWVSQSVSEWQGHLLSCSGQLKSLLCQSYIANIPIKSYKFCSKNFEHGAASCHWYFCFLLMRIFYHSFQLTINAQFTIVALQPTLKPINHDLDRW